MSDVEEKPLSEMSEQELLDYLKALRARRAQAKERRKAGIPQPRKKTKGEEVHQVSGAVGDVLDDILFGDDPPKESVDDALFGGDDDATT